MRVNNKIGRSLRDAVERSDIARQVNADGKGDLESLNILIDALKGVGLVEVDGNDGDILWVIGVELVQLRGCGIALAAPTGPELQKESLAFELLR